MARNSPSRLTEKRWLAKSPPASRPRSCAAADIAANLFLIEIAYYGVAFLIDEDESALGNNFSFLKKGAAQAVEERFRQLRRDAPERYGRRAGGETDAEDRQRQKKTRLWISVSMKRSTAMSYKSKRQRSWLRKTRSEQRTLGEKARTFETRDGINGEILI